MELSQLAPRISYIWATAVADLWSIIMQGFIYRGGQGGASLLTIYNVSPQEIYYLMKFATTHPLCVHMHLKWHTWSIRYIYWGEDPWSGKRELVRGQSPGEPHAQGWTLRTGSHCHTLWWGVPFYMLTTVPRVYSAFHWGYSFMHAVHMECIPLRTECI